MRTSSLNNALPPWIHSHRVLLTCGVGGVGKTSLAAALALRAATSGLRTVVLTIDPAKRLADALGVAQLSNTLHRVWPSEISARVDTTIAYAPSTPRGSLDVTMLDATQTFAEIIRTHAADTATAEKILCNPLFIELARAITGAQELMAVERLYQLMQIPEIDLIMIDTPPAQHALDFFAMPLRLARALDHRVLSLLLARGNIATGAALKLLHAGLRVVGGKEFFAQIHTLLESVFALLQGFAERARTIETLLRSPQTACVLVTTPTPSVIQDTLAFLDALGTHHAHLAAVLINRLSPAAPPLAWSTLPRVDPQLRTWMRTHYDALTQRAAAENRALAPLHTRLASHTPMIEITERAESIHSLAALEELGKNF